MVVNMMDHRTERYRLVTLTATLLSGLAVAPVASALEFTAATELGARFNSNARRSSTNEDHDVVYTPSIIAGVEHVGNGISVLANYELARRMYQEDYFDDETRLTGYANVNWQPLPERFDVRLTQQRAETTRQSFGRGTQDDRQIISSSEVAPRLSFQPRGNDDLLLEYQYTDTRSDEEDIDNERQSATASYRYAISGATGLTLTAIRGETKYEFEGVPQIDFTTYQATIDYDRGRNRLVMTGGESTYEREGQPDAKGPIWDVTYTNLFSSVSSFSIGASRAITDRSQELLDVDSRQYEEFAFENSDLTDIFESDEIFAEISHSFGATSASLRLEQAESDYERVPRDEQRQTVRVAATRLIRREIEAQATLSFDRVEYDQLPTDYDQFNAEFSVLWDVNRRFETEGGVFLLKRNGRGAASGFDDYGFFLSARYYFTGHNLLDDDR